MTDPVDWAERDSRDAAQGGRQWGQVALGIGLVMLEHLLFGGLLGGGGYMMVNFGGSEMGLLLASAWLFTIGAAQLVYVVPTFVVTFFWRRPVAAGVALGALATFLLNGACFGALCSTMTF